MALTQISTAGVKDDIVTSAKIADDAVIEALIADDSVDEARLKISNAGSDGQALTKQSGNTGGLTWATISAGISDIVSDTSPQLGGDLDTNSFEISLDDAHSVKFGDGNDLKIYHTGGDNRLENHGANLYLRTGASGDETSAVFVGNGAVKLYYDNSLKFETTSVGIRIPVDSGKLEFGADQDTQLIHDGSDFFIQNKTGDLFIACNVDDDDGGNIYIRPKNGENSVSCIHDGAVELYHDGNKKFETTSTGAQITSGNFELTAADTQKLILGAGEDLEIYHDGSHTYFNNTGGQTHIRGTSTVHLSDNAGYDHVIGTKDGSVAVYYDGSKKFETTSEGVKLGDSVKLALGADADAKLYETGSKLWLDVFNNHDFGIAVGAGNENSAEFKANGSVDLYYDNSKKFETTNTGISVTGKIEVSDDLDLTGASYNALWDKSANALKFYDSAQVKLGTGDDVTFYHDGSNTFLNSGTGYLLINNTASTSTILRGASDVFMQTAGGEQGVIARANGATELYYDDARKIYTSPSGVVIQNDAYFQNDASVLYMGADNDGLIFHSGSNFHIRNTTGNLYLEAKADENSIRCDADGPVRLYYDAVQKLETRSDGVEVNGDLILGDDKQIKFGSNDLRIYHSASAGDSYIEGTSRDIVIRTTTAHFVEIKTNDETAVKCNANSSVELFYDNSQKLETISTGGNITGGIRVGGNNAANELDDYEEGTWTPEFVGHSTNGSGTYSSRGAWYVKVGRQVTVGGYGSWTAHTGAGNMRINNLPFSRKSGDGYAQAGAVLTTNWNYNAGEQAVCYAESGTELLFMQVYDNESWEGMQLDSNAACMFGLSYWTDS